MILFLQSILLLFGVIFILTAAYGLFKFKNPASRLHPPTKASALGLTLILLASVLRVVANDGLHGLFQAHELLLIPFVILVSPLAGHVLLRALKKPSVRR